MTNGVSGMNIMKNINVNKNNVALLQPPDKEHAVKPALLCKASHFGCKDLSWIVICKDSNFPWREKIQDGLRFGNAFPFY